MSKENYFKLISKREGIKSKLEIIDKQIEEAWLDIQNEFIVKNKNYLTIDGHIITKNITKKKTSKTDKNIYIGIIGKSFVEDNNFLTKEEWKELIMLSSSVSMTSLNNNIYDMEKTKEELAIMKKILIDAKKEATTSEEYENIEYDIKKLIKEGE